MSDNRAINLTFGLVVTMAGLAFVLPALLG